MARLVLGPDPARGQADTRMPVYAVVDTGSPFSVIQSGTWELYHRRRLIELLPLPAGSPALTVAGGSVTYQLGRMWVGVLDPDAAVGDRRRRLPAIPILFLLPPRPIGQLPHPILVGLHDGILAGRWLVREPIAPVPGPGDRYNAGPRYGQQWWLQDTPP